MHNVELEGISPFDHWNNVNQLPNTQAMPSNTLPPLDRRDIRSAGYTGGRVHVHAVPFPRDARVLFSSAK